MVLSVERITDKEFKKFDTLDQSLIASKDFIRNFGEAGDFIEAHLYTENGDLIFSDYKMVDFKVPGSKGANDKSLTDVVELNPGAYIESLGYTVGKYNIEYNFYRKKITDLKDRPFFIKEISSDRTELRLSSNVLSNSDIETGTLNFIYEFQSSPYYKDFLLNFGDNKQVNAVKVVLDKNTDPYSILIKLYKPLPSEFDLKNTCWIVEELSESYIYSVDIFPEIQEVKPKFLKGANFDIEEDHNSIRTSDYITIDGLLANNDVATYQKLLNKINDRSVSVNIDYTDYNNFVHYSSAKERLLNFKYKLSLIESYQSDIESIQSVTNYNIARNVSSSIFTLQNSINDIIQNFDGYDNYLYYASESTAWPKSGSLPYSLYPIASTEATTWLGTDDYNSNNYGGQISTASLFDQQNQDILVLSVPEFIAVDSNNQPYLTFLNMVGQFFDNIWVYIKSINDLYKNKNNLNTGISKDVVFYALQNMGIKVYNSKSNDDIYRYFLGTDSSGSYNPVTSSYETLVTSSLQISGEDNYKEILKRIYHNAPYLLKSKGTTRGLKSLITAFGIPSTILDVNEYGGADKSSETIEYNFDRFTYALYNSGSSYIKLPWAPLTQNAYKYGVFDVVPDTIEFRFKPDKFTTNYSSSILSVIASGSNQPSFGITINYAPVNQLPYGNVIFSLSGSAGYISSSVSLPLFVTGSQGDTDWWNVMLRRRYSKLSAHYSEEQYYDVFVKNEISGRIGHQASASLYVSGSVSSSYNYAWGDYGTSSSIKNLYLGGTGSNGFSGHLQEFRYWSAPLSESAFNSHILNPESIQGNDSGSAYNDLAARFPLGNNLLTYNHYPTGALSSVHPDHNIHFSSGSFTNMLGYGYGIYGTVLYGDSSSFSSSYVISINSASLYNFPDKINYEPFTEFYYTNTPNAVYSNPVTEKVRIVDNVITGSVLSPFLCLEDKPEVELTKDIHLIDASFSPQNEVNKDVIAEYGETINIDDLIGDPSEDFNDSYTGLSNLNKEYRNKYTDKTNYRDYIRVVNFFNNSLFKMIKDYVPARSNLLTGLTIKSPILERPKVKNTVTTVEDYHNYTASIGGYTLTSDSVYTSSYGNGSDFFTGELSGSIIDYKNDFIDKNVNPYNQLSPYAGDYEKFVRSDFNPVINVVSGSRKSLKFQKIDVNNPSIVGETDTQDSNYSLQSYLRPRYDGSKSTSKLYNFYTPGDYSYGKNAAIDFNVEKFAWVSEVNEKNLNIYDKSWVNIKYLINQSGSVIALTKANANLFEVQNTFKSSTDTAVSLLDPLNPTNQHNLNGVQNIFVGGYSFTPIIYREINETMQFDYLNPRFFITGSLGFKAISTSSLRWETVGNEDVSLETTGHWYLNNTLQSLTSFALSNGVPSNWYYPTQIPFSFSGPVVGYNGSTSNMTENPNGAAWYSMDRFLPFTTNTSDGYITTDFTSSIVRAEDGVDNFIAFTAPRQSTYNINVSLPFTFKAPNPDNGGSSFKVVGVLEKKNGSAWNYLAKTTFQIVSIPNHPCWVNAAESFVWFDSRTGDPTWSEAALSVKCVLNNYQISLQQGDEVRLKLYFLDIDLTFAKCDDIRIAIPSDGYFEVYDKINSTIVPITYDVITTSPAIFSLNTDNKTLIFNNSASLFYNNTIFSSSGSSVSSNYSEIDYDFSFQVGDLVRFGTFFTLNATFYEIVQIVDPVITSVSSIPVVTTPLSVVLNQQINSADFSTSRFAVLRKVPDETSVMLNFNKREGKTSSGELIPYNLDLDIRQRIPDIVGPLKSKLLSPVLVIN